MLMKGNYITNAVNGVSIKVDFYLLKGIVENLLKYLGFKNRYDFETVEIKNCEFKIFWYLTRFIND